MDDRRGASRAGSQLRGAVHAAHRARHCRRAVVPGLGADGPADAAARRSHARVRRAVHRLVDRRDARAADRERVVRLGRMAGRVSRHRADRPDLGAGLAVLDPASWRSRSARSDRSGAREGRAPAAAPVAEAAGADPRACSRSPRWHRFPGSHSRGVRSTWRRRSASRRSPSATTCGCRRSCSMPLRSCSGISRPSTIAKAADRRARCSRSAWCSGCSLSCCRGCRPLGAASAPSRSRAPESRSVHARHRRRARAHSPEQRLVGCRYAGRRTIAHARLYEPADRRVGRSLSQLRCRGDRARSVGTAGQLRVAARRVR